MSSDEELVDADPFGFAKYAHLPFFRRPAAAGAREPSSPKRRVPHEQEEDDDPNWDKGLLGYSEDENSQEKNDRKKARRERAIEESCIAAEAEAIRKQEEEEAREAEGLFRRKKHKKEKKKKKKKKKARKEKKEEEEEDDAHNNSSGDDEREEAEEKEERTRKIPSVNLRLHAGVKIATIGDVSVSVPLASKLPNCTKPLYASRYGDMLRDKSLADDGKSAASKGQPQTHRSAHQRETRDIDCIREAHRSGGDMGEFSIRLGLSRGLNGSKERADKVVTQDPRHHTLSKLPPFTAFTPPCEDTHITKPVGDRTRIFPKQLQTLQTVDTIYMPKDVALTCPCLNGFETISGVGREKLASGNNKAHRVTKDEDATFKHLFRVRSSYSNISRLYWLELSPREVVTGHIIAQDLVEMSGIIQPSGTGPLRPVTDFFEPLAFNPPDGRVPWNCGEQSSLRFYNVPVSTEGVPDHKNDTWIELTDALLEYYTTAIAAVISATLPDKRVVFQDDRDPSRPSRNSTFSEAAMRRFFEARPDLACLPDKWDAVSDIRPTDRVMLKERYLAYIAGYLDWRYFVLQDYTLGVLAIAYETVYPGFNEAMPIRVLEYESKNAGKARLRMCQDSNISSTPAIHILFHYYRETCYEKYAAALLVWNFIGGKKVELDKRIAPHKADRQRIKALIKQGRLEASQTKLPRLPPAKYRPEIVPMDAVYDMYGMLEGNNVRMSDANMGAFAQHVIEKLNDVYKWNFYPELCHKKFFSRPIQSDRINPASVDKSLAVAQRREEEQRVLRELAENPKEVPEEWKGHEADIVRLASRRSKTVISMEHLPEDCQVPLKRALELFDESFAKIGQTDKRRFGHKPHIAYWTSPKAIRLIRAFMRKHGELENPKRCNHTMMCSYILDNRRDVPKIKTYTSRPTKSILFNLSDTSELGLWYHANSLGTNGRFIKKWGR